MKKLFKKVKSPVMCCTDINEARELFKGWKRALSLSDWNIVLNLTDSDDALGGDVGEARVNVTHRCGTITVTPHTHYKDNTFIECFEETIVHELLHFKLLAMDLIECDKDDVHSYFYGVEHQTLQDIARSLICAKYNLSPKWEWTKEH